MTFLFKRSGLKISGTFVFAFFISVAIFLESCSSKSAVKDESTNDLIPTDTFSQVHIKYAKGFNVKYGDHYKVVEVYHPSEGSKDTLRYLLLPHGVQKPEEYKNLKTIEIPVKRIVCLSTTHVALASMLDAENLIVGISGARFIYDDKVKKLIADRQIAEVRGDESLDNEKILSLHPDIIMAYRTGIADYDGYGRLEEMGLKVVINGDYMETTPLGLAEWVKFFSVFINKEREANEKFATVEHEYNDLVALAAKAQNQPMVFTGISWNGTWSVPGGESFAAKYLKDAGSKYVWSGIASSGKLIYDFEKVYKEAYQADYWINPGSMKSLHDIESQDTRYKNFAAFKSGAVYNGDARVNENGGFDYFESGVTHPQTILADLIHILHPELLPDHELVYYRQLK